MPQVHKTLSVHEGFVNIRDVSVDETTGINDLPQGENSSPVQPRISIGRLPNGTVDHIGASTGLNVRNRREVVNDNEDTAKEKPRNGYMILRNIPTLVRVGFSTNLTAHDNGRVTSLNQLRKLRQRTEKEKISNVAKHPT